jgi:chromosome segregation ATPase
MDGMISKAKLLKWLKQLPLNASASYVEDKIESGTFDIQTDVDDYECIVCEKKGCSCFSRKSTDVDVKEIESRCSIYEQAQGTTMLRVGQYVKDIRQLLTKLAETQMELKVQIEYSEQLEKDNYHAEANLTHISNLLTEKEAEAERLKARVTDLEDAKGDYFDNEPDATKKLNQAVEALEYIRPMLGSDISNFEVEEAWYRIDEAIQSIKGQ